MGFVPRNKEEETILVNISEIESPSRETWTSRKASQPLRVFNVNIINQRLGKNQLKVS